LASAWMPSTSSPAEHSWPRRGCPRRLHLQNTLGLGVDALRAPRPGRGDSNFGTFVQDGLYQTPL
jgi:hypothetical protein